MMKALLTSSAAALTLIGATALSTAPAQAQSFGIRVGPGGVSIGEDRPRIEHRVIERRAPARRVIVEDDEGDEVCETRTRRMMVNGVMRTRRVTVCE